MDRAGLVACQSAEVLFLITIGLRQCRAGECLACTPDGLLLLLYRSIKQYFPHALSLSPSLSLSLSCYLLHDKAPIRSSFSTLSVSLSLSLSQSLSECDARACDKAPMRSLPLSLSFRVSRQGPDEVFAWLRSSRQSPVEVAWFSSVSLSLSLSLSHCDARACDEAPMRSLPLFLSFRVSRQGPDEVFAWLRGSRQSPVEVTWFSSLCLSLSHSLSLSLSL